MNNNVKNLMAAKLALAEARRAVYEEVFSALDSNGKFAYEIAEETNIPMPIVVGVLQSDESCFERSYRRSGHSVIKHYARIKNDGTIDMNDTVKVKYCAAKYYKRG